MISRQEILNELRSYWFEAMGSRREFVAETGIVQWCKDAGMLDEFDIADIQYILMDVFGVQIPDDEWNEFWEFGTEPDVWERDIEPQITFGRLADLIRAHLPDVSFDAVQIAGRACGPAGAFFGMQELVGHVVDRKLRFGPSTKVKDCLPGKTLPRFWSQLRFLTRNALPPLSDPLWSWSVRMGVLALGFGLVSLLLTCAHAKNEVPWQVFRVIIMGFSITGLLAFALGFVRFIGGSRLLRLPDGIQTFRDLAKQITTTRSK